MEKRNNFFKSKRNIIIIGMILSIVMITLFVIFNKDSKTLMLSSNAKDGIIIELGEQIPTDKELYLNVEKMDTEILDKVTIEIDNIDSEYPSVGEYDVTISFEDEVLTVGVEVKDTTSPTFSDDFKNEIETVKEVEIDFEDVYKDSVSDLSEVTISIDGDINYVTVGECEITIIATDEYNNVSENKVIVKVIEPTITVNKKDLSLTVGNSDTLIANVIGKDSAVVWQSSDTSIATVDSNGKVVGIKVGKVTVTATANSVNTTVSITVNAKSSTPTQPSTPAPTQPTTPSNPGNGNIGGNTPTNSVEMLAQINSVRAQLGRPQLTMRNELSDAAKAGKGNWDNIYSHLESTGYCDTSTNACQEMRYSFGTTSSFSFMSGSSDVSADYKYIGIALVDGVWYRVVGK